MSESNKWKIETGGGHGLLKLAHNLRLVKAMIGIKYKATFMQRMNIRDVPIVVQTLLYSVIVAERFRVGVMNEVFAVHGVAYKWKIFLLLQKSLP